MLDLVDEEEQIARLTGLGFEELLAALDALEPDELAERYAGLADRYMVLAGKGQRDADQEVDLDRLDTALRMMLGEHGLLVLAGRLVRIQRAALLGLAVFETDRSGPGELLVAQQGLGRSARLAAGGLRGPVPVEAPELAELARRAGAAAAELVSLGAGRGRRARAAEALSRLLVELGQQNGGPRTWEAVEALFDPGAGPSGQLLERLRLCRRLAGWLACGALLQITSAHIAELAGLVREGLGA